MKKKLSLFSATKSLFPSVSPDFPPAGLIAKKAAKPHCCGVRAKTDMLSVKSRKNRERRRRSSAPRAVISVIRKNGNGSIVRSRIL